MSRRAERLKRTAKIGNDHQKNWCITYIFDTGEYSTIHLLGKNLKQIKLMTFLQDEDDDDRNGVAPLVGDHHRMTSSLSRKQLMGTLGRR